MNGRYSKGDGVRSFGGMALIFRRTQCTIVGSQGGSAFHGYNETISGKIKTIVYKPYSTASFENFVER